MWRSFVVRNVMSRYGHADVMRGLVENWLSHGAAEVRETERGEGRGGEVKGRREGNRGGEGEEMNTRMHHSL